MSRVRLYIKNMKANLGLNLILILQIGFIFLVINANVSDLIYRKNLNYYFEELPQNIYFLSGVVDMNVSPGDGEHFFEFVKDLEQQYDVLVGYQIEDGVLLERYNSQVLSCFYLSPAMCKIKYPLDSGHWFNESKEEQVEIILGGTVAKKYSIGETAILYQRDIINNKAEYSKTEAVVIGKLQEPTYLIDLGYASNFPTYTNLFKEYENVIITNQYIFEKKEFIRYPLMSLMIEDTTTNSLTFINELSDYGQLFDLHEIDTYSRDAFYSTLKSKIAPNLIILIAIVFGTIGTTYLFNYKIMKSISVFFLCGMDKRLYENLILINNAVIILLGFLIACMLYFVKSIQEVLFPRQIFGLWNIMASIFISFIFVLISLVCAKYLSKTSSYQMLRRFE